MNFSAIAQGREKLCYKVYALPSKYTTLLVKIMRVTFVLGFFILVSAQLMLAATLKAQDIQTTNVTLGLKHESLESAIRQIEDQTSLRFYYRRSDIKNINNLNLPDDSRTIGETLEALLENTFISFKQVDGNILLQRTIGQEAYEIRGKVLDVNRRPLEFASVRLRKKGDDQTIQSAQTDTAGNFKLRAGEKGDYLIRITSIGKDSIDIAVTLAESRVVTLPELVMNTSVKQLQQVSVVAAKPLIEQQIDRTVLNVDALISNAGLTALEILEKAPGVMVEQNGSIILKGKSGVSVFIDNKPTYLSGEDLQNYLRSLPSSTLDKIEIMTNPPAQYDAAGNGGVINIKTKKSAAKGFNGSVSLAYAQGKYSRTNDGINFNYRNGTLNFFGNLSYGIRRNFNDLDINRQYLHPDGSPSGFFNQHSYIDIDGHNLGSRFGLDFYASDKTTFGVLFTGALRPWTRTTDAKAFLQDAIHVTDSTVIAHNAENYHDKNGGINFNYRHEYDKDGRELTADLDYLVYTSQTDQQFNNSTYLPDQTLSSQDQRNGNLPANVHIYSLKTDYSHPVNDKMKLMAGLKSSFTRTDNLAEYTNLNGTVFTPDYDLSNHFIYNENINAAYVNLNKDYQKLSIEAGLRFENTNSKGHQLGNAQKPDSSFTRNYNSLFPTIFLLYKLDTLKNHQLGFKVGRRIERPFYQDLNPFISPIDKFTYYLGNPLLNPSYSTDVELSHTFKERLTTTISYGHVSGSYGETIEIVNGIYYDRPGNIATSNFKSISIDGTLDPAKWLNIHLYAELTGTQYHSPFYNGTLDTKGTFFYVNPMLQFKISDTWNAQLTGYYRSALTSAQFVIGRRGQIDAAVSKKLSASTSLKLATNDIFYSMINSGDITNLVNARASYRNRNDTRYGILTLSYRFGKAIANQRKHDANGAESEQSRVKQ